MVVVRSGATFPDAVRVRAPSIAAPRSTSSVDPRTVRRWVRTAQRKGPPLTAGMVVVAAAARFPVRVAARRKPIDERCLWTMMRRTDIH